MTHVTCRLTAKTGISCGTLHSVIEYGLPCFHYSSMSCTVQNGLQSMLLAVVGRQWMPRREKCSSVSSLMQLTSPTLSDVWTSQFNGFVCVQPWTVTVCICHCRLTNYELLRCQRCSLQVALAEWLVRPTAVWEDPGSNCTTGGCVYCDSHCNMQPWAWAVHLYCSA